MGLGERLRQQIRATADYVTGVNITSCGHDIPDAREAMLAAPIPFLTPYNAEG